MSNKDIIQELSDLGSSLPNTITQNIYSVPVGYFEGFAQQVLNIVKSEENLSSLSSLPKDNPYKVPAGYFDELEKSIMEKIHGRPHYETSREELETLSPLLGNLDKRPVYSVPKGYFENFKVATEPARSEAKVIPITSRKWFRYAAAAMIIGVISLVGMMIYKNNHKDAAGRTMAKFEKEVKKIDDVKSTESLIDFMDAGLNEKELASNHKTIRTEDVQQLLQDVSLDELKDFNEQSKDIQEVMLAN